jgi:hypothetical protein
MTGRDRKMIKALCVLVPLLGLAAWYGYQDVQAVKARRAKRRKQANEQNAQAPASPGKPSPTLAADPGTSALPSPPPGATPADHPAHVPPAASSSGVRVNVDPVEQERRMRLPWGRDPFTPPDTEGPRISPPSDLESPRDRKTLALRVPVTDRFTGNSGVASVRLSYGEQEPFDEHELSGTAPGTRNGDGTWTFRLPAPTEKPYGCFVTAVDGGRLRSRSRSRVFRIIPPPPDTVELPARGTGVKLTLRGISWTSHGAVALINNEVVGVGEFIAGYEVVRVARNAVVLQRDQQEIVLQLKE